VRSEPDPDLDSPQDEESEADAEGPDVPVQRIPGRSMRGDVIGATVISALFGVGIVVAAGPSVCSALLLAVIIFLALLGLEEGRKL
jgi:hypothetical protein